MQLELIVYMYVVIAINSNMNARCIHEERSEKIHNGEWFTRVYFWAEGKNPNGNADRITDSSGNNIKDESNDHYMYIGVNDTIVDCTFTHTIDLNTLHIKSTRFSRKGTVKTVLIDKITGDTITYCKFSNLISSS